MLPLIRKKTVSAAAISAALTVLIFFMTVRGAGSSISGPVRARDAGLIIGELSPGRLNAITDVSGVKVGHKTIIEGDSIRTGVTAILPHTGNIYSEKVPAALFVGNGFGKLSGISQVRELGNIETPIILTNTLSVGTAMEAVVRYTIGLPANRDVRTVNPVVGETNDGFLNDIREMRVTEQDVIEAIELASGGEVAEGCVGAGTGTVVFGFKGGIGTSSRVVTLDGGKEYTIGVLAQTNYSGALRIDGVRINIDRPNGEAGRGDEGSCMIVIATDAPLSPRNLERLAARGIHGLARTGSFMSNGSGDYVIAFSTAYRIRRGESFHNPPELIANRSMTVLFRAVIEAAEESIYNSMFMAVTSRGYRGREARALPVGKVLEIIKNSGQKTGRSD